MTTMITLTKIKEFSSLVSQANKLGTKEIKLDRATAVALLAEINVVMAGQLETLSKTPRTQNNSVTNLNGGGFK